MIFFIYLYIKVIIILFRIIYIFGVSKFVEFYDLIKFLSLNQRSIYVLFIFLYQNYLFNFSANNFFFSQKISIKCQKEKI